jgi:FkbM family methyltransferase
MKKINIDENEYVVPDHWFWKEFNLEWEPQTKKFFKKYLKRNTAFLDIGAWIGPTSLMAFTYGASKVKSIEPNPNSFKILEQIKSLNNLNDWQLLQNCVSNKRGTEIIGPIQGINHISSATSIQSNDNGVEVTSVLLSDLIDDDYSLIKIDIEGAESLILDDLLKLADNDVAIWLSLHPPNITNKIDLLSRLKKVSELFYIVDDDDKFLSFDKLENMIMSKNKLPPWGTKFGNFFEIGLLSNVRRSS